MIIRDATQEDVEEILNLSEIFWNEINSPLKLNKQKVMKFVNYVIFNSDSTIRVCVVENIIVGGCILSISESMFSSEKVVQELGWFVHPDHRGVGKFIFNDAIKWAKGKGKFIVFALMNNKYASILTRLYENNGFYKLETHYIKEI